MQSAVVLLSGGIGSTVAAFRGARDSPLHLLHLDYGRESSSAEGDAAAAVAEALAVPLERLELPHVARIAASKSAAAAASGESSTPAPGASGDVDGLMAVFLAIGAEYAAAVGADVLITGQTGAPLDGGPDSLSRERTVDPRELHHAFAGLLATALPSVRAVRLETPLIDLQPFEVIKLSRRFEVPLACTWSCHSSPPPCGACPGCKTRSAAFAKTGLIDPLLQPASR